MSQQIPSTRLRVVAASFALAMVTCAHAMVACIALLGIG